jgi:DNA-binding LacI/PurR family transcriptional regulator
MNLEQVAKRARVSTSTVSRVLNNIDVVKSSTRARVMKAIADLKYQPNLHARMLAEGKSRTIGVIVSNMENPFFFDIFRMVEAEAHKHGYEVLVAHTDYRSEQLVSSVRLMIGRRVAGLAAIVSEMDAELIQELVESGIPVVFYDVGTAARNITNIRVNYQKGVEQIIMHLRDLGHHRLAFVGHHSTLGPIDDRRKAFQSAVRRHIPGAEVRTVANADSLEGGRDAARELLASGFGPTAIVCVNDFTAVGVLREVRDRGLHVPGDLSVTGFDNVKLAEFCYPALTTSHIPRDRIGAIAVEYLLTDGGKPAAAGRDVIIDPELVVRASTGPVAQPALMPHK